MFCLNEYRDYTFIKQIQNQLTKRKIFLYIIRTDSSTPEILQTHVVQKTEATRNSNPNDVNQSF